MPGVDVDAVLTLPTTRARGLPVPAAAPIMELSSTERETLADLVSRLQNQEEMRRAGLDLDGNRLRAVFRKNPGTGQAAE